MISCFLVHPVPRYFFSVLLIAICLPIAIVASDHCTFFPSPLTTRTIADSLDDPAVFETLSNLLYVLGYWIGLYLPPVIIESLVFRNPVSIESYPLDGWDGKALPWGYATVLSWIFVRLVASLHRFPLFVRSS